MPLTDLDRQLIARCLEREPEAWYEFVDRYLGVVFHVIHHTSHMRSVPLRTDEVEDLAADVLAAIVDSNFKILRRFRGKSSLANYLAVISRRLVVTKLARRAAYERRMQNAMNENVGRRSVPPDLFIENEEEVHRLLDTLDGKEADLVRAFYLEHKTYGEISDELGIPENSIGPTLSRLREQIRKARANS